MTDIGFNHVHCVLRKITKTVRISDCAKIFTRKTAQDMLWWQPSLEMTGQPARTCGRSARAIRSLFACPIASIVKKAMAPHSSTLAWKIPWMEEPGRLQSRELLRVRHDWATSLSLFTFMHWRRKWQPTPVFLPGESQGRGSLVGCHLWGRTESDTTEST